FAQRNFNTISSIYGLTVYPNQVPIIVNGGAAVPPGLFSQDVVGRVDPVGDFIGFEASIEYFFALAPIPQPSDLFAAITSYKITEFSSGCPGVASSVVYLYCSVVNPGAPDDGTPLPPLKQVAFWKFDASGAVLKYDAWIPRLNAWLEQTAGGVSVTDPQFQAGTIAALCDATQQRCLGPDNVQWNSTAQCVAALAQKPFGNYDEARGDNVVCRAIHIILTVGNPETHCPHVGPTGGGACIDVPYGHVFEDEDVYSDPIGETFVCK
ncbi:hypothetical protein B0T26DRAFT_833320, partial [Lasiosphaeria miniovina]